MNHSLQHLPDTYIQYYRAPITMHACAPTHAQSNLPSLTFAEDLILQHIALVRHVDAVKELADILALDSADLLDERARAADVINVIALEHNLVLHVSATLDRHIAQCIHNAHNLLAQEVSDLHALVLVDNRHVDREVGINKTHLVQEALGHADDRVHDVAVACADGCVRLPRGEPALYQNGAVGVVRKADVNGHVLEAACKGAARALHDNNPRFDRRLDAFWQFKRRRLEDGLHDSQIGLLGT
mmetsp:Transcript_8089/g.18997  ORF Transcript_8089/g.18997 Transcript_8089/m.18997 type:complete len:243 (-) Transcript_8089:26-754(-)